MGALVCVPQGSCSQREMQAANASGQSSQVGGLGFWRAAASPSSPAVPRNLLGKCQIRVASTWKVHSIGFRLLD